MKEMKKGRKDELNKEWIKESKVRWMHGRNNVQCTHCTMYCKLHIIYDCTGINE